MTVAGHAQECDQLSWGGSRAGAAARSEARDATAMATAWQQVAAADSPSGARRREHAELLHQGRPGYRRKPRHRPLAQRTPPPFQVLLGMGIARQRPKKTVTV